MYSKICVISIKNESKFLENVRKPPRQSVASSVTIAMQNLFSKIMLFKTRWSCYLKFTHKDNYSKKILQKLLLFVNL